MIKGHTHRQAHIQTDAGDGNTSRPKLALGKKGQKRVSSICALMCALAMHMCVHTLDDGEEMNEASYTRSNSKYDKSEAEFSCSY